MADRFMAELADGGGDVGVVLEAHRRHRPAGGKAMLHQKVDNARRTGLYAVEIVGFIAVVADRRFDVNAQLVDWLHAAVTARHGHLAAFLDINDNR
jgi:hypothetical protein